MGRSFWRDDPEWDAEDYSTSKEDFDEAYMRATGMPPERDEWEDYDE